MAATGLEVFDKTLHTTNMWLDEIGAEIGPDKHLAWHVLGAVLRSIRDELPVDHAAHLAAQLPLLVRGAYFDQYRPAEQPRSARSVDEFTARIHKELASSRPVNPTVAATAVMRTLNRHVTGGQIRKVRDTLPKGVRALWPAPNEAEKATAPPRTKEAKEGAPRSGEAKERQSRRAASAPSQKEAAGTSRAPARLTRVGATTDTRPQPPETEASSETNARPRTESMAQTAPGLPNDSSMPVEVDRATAEAVERAMRDSGGSHGGSVNRRPSREGE